MGFWADWKAEEVERTHEWALDRQRRVESKRARKAAQARADAEAAAELAAMRARIAEDLLAARIAAVRAAAADRRVEEVRAELERVPQRQVLPRPGR